MSLIKYGPFANLDRFLDDSLLTPSRRYGWDMAVDVFEAKDQVTVKMSLPGINPDDLDLSLDDHLLSISGERKEEHEVDDKEYYSKEIRRGSFLRVVELPTTVDATRAEASYADGLLCIVFPKLPTQERKGIKISVKK